MSYILFFLAGAVYVLLQERYRKKALCRTVRWGHPATNTFGSVKSEGLWEEDIFDMVAPLMRMEPGWYAQVEGE